MTGALALPALALAVTAGSTPSRSAASTATASIVPVSQVTMSDCALSVTQCEVEVADLSDPTSIRLTDGALSVAPTRVISIALRSEGQPRVRHVEKPLSLHAYFKLPKAKRARWRLMVESRHHQRRSFALPTPRPPTSTL